MHSPLLKRALTATALLTLILTASACERLAMGPIQMGNASGQVTNPNAFQAKYSSASMRLEPVLSSAHLGPGGTSGAALVHDYGTARPTGTGWLPDPSVGEESSIPAWCVNGRNTLPALSVPYDSSAVDANGNDLTDLDDPAGCAVGIAGYVFVDRGTAGVPAPLPYAQDGSPNSAWKRPWVTQETRQASAGIDRLAKVQFDLLPLYRLTNATGTPRFATSPCLPALANAMQDARCTASSTQFGGIGHVDLVGYGFDPANVPSTETYRTWSEYPYSGAGSDYYYAADDSGATWAASNGYTGTARSVIALRAQAPMRLPIVKLTKGTAVRFSTKQLDTFFAAIGGWQVVGQGSNVALNGYVWDQAVPGTQPYYEFIPSGAGASDQFRYSTSADLGSGWVRSRVLGWVYSDRQPWTSLLAPGSVGAGAAPYVLDSAGGDTVPYFEVNQPTGPLASGATPVGATGAPIMVVIHGGGFDAGMQRWDGAPTWMATGVENERFVGWWNAHGWKTYNIDYQVGLQQAIPGVAAFIQELRTVTGSTVPICATGFSAGATLSIALAGRNAVDCAIALSGPTSENFLSTQTYMVNTAAAAPLTPQRLVADPTAFHRPLLMAATDWEPYYMGTQSGATARDHEVDSSGGWYFAQEWEAAHPTGTSIVSPCVEAPPGSTPWQQPAALATTSATTWSAPPDLEMLCLQSGFTSYTGDTTTFVHDPAVWAYPNEVVPNPLTMADSSLVGLISTTRYLAAQERFASQVLAHWAPPAP